ERAPENCPEYDSLGPEGLEFGPKQFRLGTLRELCSRKETCPFCSLAVGSLREQCDAFLRQAGKENKTEEHFYNTDVVCLASWQIDGRVLIRDINGKVV